MAQKNATPTQEQSAILRKHDLQPFQWVVVKDFQHSMIIKDRITGEFKSIEK